jgi:subtilisin family serine protease
MTGKPKDDTMFRSIPIFLAILAAAPPAPAAADTCGALAGRIDNFIIVRVKPESTLEAFIDAVQQQNPGLTAWLSDSVPNRPIHLLELALPPGWSPAQYHAFEQSLKTDYPQLAWGETLYTDIAPEGKTGSTFVDGPINLSMYQAQYAGGQIALPAAQQRSTGLGVVVAVLDTGVDASHPLLAGHIAPGGYNFVEGNSDTHDGGTGALVGHGTYVAGLVRFVAPEAMILPIRVLDADGRGDLWWLTRGMFHAIDRGVEVINISISSTYKGEGVEDAAREAKELGIVTVAAAGNCNTDNPREFPAMQSNVFGVAAVNQNDVKAPFSNYHDKIFLSAPGTMAYVNGEPDPSLSIMSATPGGGYAYWEGTSMAAPLVAGAVGLVRAQHPEWPASVSTWYTIEAIFAATADDIDGANPQYEEELGVGRVNAAAATMTGPVAPALGDLNNDGTVNVYDLLTLLAAWGLTHTSADLNGDGTVDVFDLLILLGNWG